MMIRTKQPWRILRPQIDEQTEGTMEIDPIELRNALGRFATGVCVVTTASEGRAPIGMTVNSFSSLSLDPPLVLWSIQRDSDCRAAFDAASTYCINVLASDQKELSGRFARKNQHEVNEADRFFEGELGLPVLMGCLVAFECTIDARLDGGDHIILVGRVKAVHQGDGDKPLLFFAGGYQELAS